MTNEDRVQRCKTAEDPREDLSALFYANMPLIKRTAARFARDEDELEDLIQECFFPLVDAVKDYDPAAECSFISYLIKRCQWHLFRYMSRQGAAVVPSHIFELAGKLRALDNESGGLCSDEEAAEALGVPPVAIEAARLALASRSPIAPLDGEDEDSDRRTLSETIADEEQLDVFERVEARASLSEVWACVDRLPALQSFAVREYYQMEKSCQEIAEELGVNSQRAAELRRTAMPVLGRMRQIQELAQVFGYDSMAAYYRGRQVFTNGTGSAPEWITEMREQHGL